MSIKVRLEKAKLKAAKVATVPYNDWQYWIKSEVKGKACRSNTGKNGELFTEDKYSIGELITNTNRNISGYYADNFQYNLVKFSVSKLHTSKGTYYIPVTWQTEPDGATYYMADKVLVLKTETSDDDHEKAYKEALRYAERCAEIEAEECREYDAKFQAEDQIDTAKEIIIESRAVIRKLTAELRNLEFKNSLPETICSVLRDSIKRTRKESHNAWKRIKELEDNYWNAVSY